MFLNLSGKYYNWDYVVTYEKNLDRVFNPSINQYEDKTSYTLNFNNGQISRFDGDDAGVISNFIASANYSEFGG